MEKKFSDIINERLLKPNGVKGANGTNTINEAVDKAEDLVTIGLYKAFEKLGLVGSITAVIIGSDKDIIKILDKQGEVGFTGYVSNSVYGAPEAVDYFDVLADRVGDANGYIAMQVTMHNKISLQPCDNCNIAETIALLKGFSKIGKKFNVNVYIKNGKFSKVEVK